MIKVFVDAHTFDESHQGIRTFLKGIYSSERVKNAGNIEFHLAAFDIQNLKNEFRGNSNIKFIKLKYRNKYIRLLYEIPKIINKFHFDFAHFNYYLPLFLNKNCKYIVTIHDVLFLEYPEFFPRTYRIKNHFLFKRSAKKAAYITTVSRYAANQIKHFFKLKNKTITVLPNAVAEIYKQDYNKQEHNAYIKSAYNIENFILYVSRIEPRKNHLFLVKAYSELELWKNGISLVLIGKTSFKDTKLERVIKETNDKPSDSVIQIENVSNEELVKFYNAATIPVFHSLCEGSEIPPIESAVLKTPTLCSNTTAMTDFTFFKDYFLDATNIKSTKEKITEVIENAESQKVKEDFKAISSKIKEVYNWNKTADILIALLHGK